jgi:dolichol-phosphate mannosyltransferase
LRPFLSKQLNFFARILFGSKIRDYTSGVAAARKTAMDKVLWKDNGFGEYFAEFSWRCIRNNLKVIEVPLVYSIRKYGVSKSDASFLVLLKYGAQYGAKMMKWRWKI